MSSHPLSSHNQDGRAQSLNSPSWLCSVLSTLLLFSVLFICVSSLQLGLFVKYSGCRSPWKVTTESPFDRGGRLKVDCSDDGMLMLLDTGLVLGASRSNQDDAFGLIKKFFVSKGCACRDCTCAG